MSHIPISGYLEGEQLWPTMFYFAIVFGVHIGLKIMGSSEPRSFFSSFEAACLKKFVKAVKILLTQDSFLIWKCVYIESIDTDFVLGIWNVMFTWNAN